MSRNMNINPVFEIERRGGPLVVSIPHVGTGIPDDLRPLYTAESLLLADTDWHLERLYAFAAELDATVIRAKVSRYVVDLNRPPTGESLYPGMITTTLCPNESLTGSPVYRDGCTPDNAEISRRVETYWQPYHSALKTELARLRELHRNILLWEAHSIASVLPRLFTGKLPDFNFGTSEGQSCNDAVAAAAIEPLRSTAHSWVLNGRFKGEFITRKYGAPEQGVHAIQLEMCQCLYMEEAAPFKWREDLASKAIPLIRSSLERAVGAVVQLSSRRSSADILPS